MPILSLDLFGLPVISDTRSEFSRGKNRQMLKGSILNFLLKR